MVTEKEKNLYFNDRNLVHNRGGKVNSLLMTMTYGNRRV
jgi:hypothetical protein